jgi:hypothetical protein
VPRDSPPARRDGIPQCRGDDPVLPLPKEADQVLAVMAENGLKRGENGLEVYVMCEIPSNVILASAFAKRFDGFSIGSARPPLAAGLCRARRMVGVAPSPPCGGARSP